MNDKKRRYTYTLMIIARNEIEGMKVVGPRIKKEWLDEVLVVDGSSTDGTPEYAESLGFTVLRQKSIGVVNGIRDGFVAAKGSVVIGYTPDNNMIPEKIPEIIAKMEEGYDMVCCSRYYQGARSEDDTLVTGFGNWLFTTLLNLAFHTNYTDVLGFYRAFRKDLLDELNIDVGFSITTRLSIRCKKTGKRVCDIGGDEPP